MSPLRSALRLALNSPRLVAAAAGVTVAEVGARALLGLLVHPVLVVLAPPVVAVVGLGVFAPGVARALESGPPVEWSGPVARPSTTALVALAVAGHSVAVGGGTAAFLLVDTPLRAVLYWFGHGDLLTPAVIVFSPLVGAGIGTLLGWATPALALAGLADGRSLRRSLAGALVAVVERPRSVAVATGWHLLVAGLLCVPAAVGFEYASGSASAVAFAAVTGGLIVLVATFALAALVAAHLGRPPPTPGATDGSASTAVRGAVAVFLVVALVVGAGVVRTTETRPIDASPDPLPDDPGGTYATALENTERASHSYRVAVVGEGGRFVVGHRIDRDDRQYQQFAAEKAVGPSVYAGAGTGSPPMQSLSDAYALGSRVVEGEGDEEQTVRAAPAYTLWEDRYDWATGSLSPPSAVDGWSVADRDDGTLVLVLSDPAAVFAATHRREPDRVSNVTVARLRAVVDTDSRTLEHVDYRFDGNVTFGGVESHQRGRVRYEFAVGTDVRRPDALGAPTPGERLWKLFVY